MGLNQQQKKLLKEAVRNQLRLDIVGIPSNCASVPRPILEQMLAFWRDNQYWFGNQPTHDPEVLTADERRSLGQAVRFHLRLDKLTLPQELSEVPRELLAADLRVWADWFNYRG